MLFYPVWEIENWKNDDSKKKHINNVEKYYEIYWQS